MGSEARARLGIAGLLAITLFSFNQVFATGDYPGPALLGMLIAVAAAMLARRLGIGSLLTLALSGVLLVAYLCLIFQIDRAYYGLPTLDALGGLWRSVQLAYAQSRVDFAPVPVRPGYVVMVVAGLWLAAAIGEVATFRWRRPLLASLPSIGLFSLVMVVGTGRAAPLLVALYLSALLAYWGLESSHRLRSWGRWIPTWKEHEYEPEPVEVTGTLARRMGAACVLLGLIVPLFIPTLGDGLLAWRNNTGGGLGFSSPGGTSEIDPLVSVAPRLINQPKTVLFEVTSARPSYWRLFTYSTFDGVQWHSTSEPESVSPSGDIFTQVPARSISRQAAASFLMRNLGGERLPTAGAPENLTFTGSNATDYDDDLRYDPQDGDVEIDRPIVEGLRYDVSSTVPEPTYKGLLNAEAGVAPTVYREFPQDLSQRVFQLANQWSSGIDNPIAQLISIQNHLRSFEYSLDVEDTGSNDYLGDFLTITRKGYCQQFATAFAILARLRGFPTRLVVGFLPGDTTISTPTHYVVRGTHAHAWPEVYLQEYGWVAFEPTPRGPAPPPLYTTEDAFGTAARPDLEYLDGGGRGNRGGRPRDQRFGDDFGNLGGAVADPERRRERVSFAWKKPFTRLAVALAILVLAYLIVTPAWKLRRIRRRYQRARGVRGLAAAAFAHFEEEAGDLVSRRAPSESAVSYANRLAAMHKVPERSALRLASIYEAAEYAPLDITPEAARDARALARQLRTSIWSDASWWERGQRLFSPAWNGRKAA